MSNARVVEYDVVIGSLGGHNCLIKQVNEKIIEGWEPLGAPMIGPDNCNYQGAMVQAMVRRWAEK